LWGWFAGSAATHWVFITILCAAALLIVAAFAYRHARRKA
jgi:acetyl esterase/lipase